MVDELAIQIRGLRQKWQHWVKEVDWNWRGYESDDSRSVQGWKTSLKQIQALSCNAPRISVLLDEIVMLLGDFHDCIGDLTTLLLNELHRLDASLLQQVVAAWHTRSTVAAQQQIILSQVFLGQESNRWELALLLGSAQQSRPQKKWPSQWEALRSCLPSDQLARLLVRLVESYSLEQVRMMSRTDDDWPRRDYSAHSDWFARDTARGAAWGLGDFTHLPDIREFLSSTVFEWSKSGQSGPAVGYAGIWALTRKSLTENLQCLSNLQVRLTHRPLKKRATNALDELATLQGMSQDEVADRIVPDYGLNREGERRWFLGEYQVKLALENNGKVSRVIYGSDQSVKRGIPKNILDSQKNEWKSIQNVQNELKKTLTNQKNRLQKAMVDERIWALDDWQRTFGQNPVLANLASRLVWLLRSDAKSEYVYGMPSNGRGWQDEEGTLLSFQVDSVSLAHPVKMSSNAQLIWQQAIVQRQIVQPFKQLFRETYVLTPAEEETRDYSNRFMGHIVQASKVYALTRGRDWNGAGLGGFDKAGVGRRDFEKIGLRAFLRLTGGENAFVERVWFEIMREGVSVYPTMECIPLVNVPAISFSETMRDIDLIVSVASIGTEESWETWEARRRVEAVQWREQRVAYEALARAQANMRADLLRQLIPNLGLEGKAELKGPFVLIQGDFGQYRIHLGSGNVHLEPSGRYVCIVPNRKKQDSLYLPFEESEPKTAEIISKIFMLVNDERIRDESILRQIKAKR